MTATPFQMTDAERVDYETYMANRYSMAEAWRLIMQSRNPQKLTATPKQNG